MFKMKKILSWIAAVLFIASVAPLAFAANEDFTALDKNKDGKISEQEYMDAAAETFDKLDKNHDGILTREEIQSNSKIDAEKFIKMINPNGEGKIVKKMYLQAAKKQFKSWDKNQDGLIDVKEWKIAKLSQKQPGLVIFTF